MDRLLRMFVRQSNARPVIEQATDGRNILTHRGLTCGGSTDELASIMRPGFGGSAAQNTRLNQLNGELLRVAGNAASGLSEGARTVVDVPIEGAQSPLETACREHRAQRAVSRR